MYNLYPIFSKELCTVWGYHLHSIYPIYIQPKVQIYLVFAYKILYAGVIFLPEGIIQLYVNNMVKMAYLQQ